MKDPAAFLPREEIKPGDTFWSKRFGLFILVVENTEKHLKYLSQSGTLHTLIWDPKHTRDNFPSLGTVKSFSRGTPDSGHYGLRWFVRYDFEKENPIAF